MGTRRILILCDYFLPGFRAGGVLRSLANLLAHLGHEYEFRLITRARDYTTTEPYPGIETRTWLPVGPAEVLYLGERELRPTTFWRLLRDAGHDVLALNSVLSPHFAITPLVLRRLRLIPDRPCIVSPNGELAVTALRIKPTKKRVYLWVAKRLGLYAGVRWRASDEREASDVRREFGPDADVTIAENLPTPPPAADPPGEAKQSGRLRLVYLSRVARIKNLAGLLEALQHVRGEVQLDLYGPKDDPEHWERCEALIAALPGNVRVDYHGSISGERVYETLGRYDFFALRTTGESFGYVIAEALSAGCPVVVSDRTPWRHLEQEGVGWDLPLEDTDAFRRVLQACVDMDAPQHAEMRKRARAYGREKARPTKELDVYRALFDRSGPPAA